MGEPLDTTALAAQLRAQVGGVRGVVDSSLPVLAFAVGRVAGGFRAALVAAVAVGLVLLVLRLLRREDVRQALYGFAGVAVAVLVATLTGNARDFFLPGLLVNAAYAAAFLVSIAVRWPLVGLAAAVLTGQDLRAWREDPVQRRPFTALTALWAAGYLLRLVVQLPLYLADQTAALAVAKLVLGWPLTVLVLLVTVRAVRQGPGRPRRPLNPLGPGGDADPA